MQSFKGDKKQLGGDSFFNRKPGAGLAEKYDGGGEVRKFKDIIF